MASDALARVRGCARCGEDHDNITWRPLTKPIAEHDGSVWWTHWTPCPTNGEPILQAEVTREQAEALGYPWGG